MRPAAEIYEDWKRNGLIVDEFGDGGFNLKSSKFIPDHVRSLVQYLPFEGEERFRQVCQNAGQKPENLLAYYAIDLETGLTFDDE